MPWPYCHNKMYYIGLSWWARYWVWPGTFVALCPLTFLYCLSTVWNTLKTLVEAGWGVNFIPLVILNPSLDTPLLQGFHFMDAWRSPDYGLGTPRTARPPSGSPSVVTSASVGVGGRGEEQAGRLCSAPMLMFVVCEGGSAVCGEGTSCERRLVDASWGMSQLFSPFRIHVWMVKISND